MHRKTLFTLAALSATCLLPVSGALAQDTSANNMDANMRNTVMDVGMFRDRLNDLKDLFNQMQENHRLSLAAADPLIAHNYVETNKRLREKALGILNEISRNWSSAPLAPVPGGDEAMRSQSIERMGTANAVRFANESEDTAFVRMTVWDLRSELQADKLNGRDSVITDRMMDQLNAAINRAENPNFRVARAFDVNRIEHLELSQAETTPAPETVEETTPAPETSTAQETTRESTTPELTEVQRRTEMERQNIHPVPETTETTVTEETTMPETTNERMGGANLPQTGGDPSLLILLGSGLAGLGALIRKRS